MSFLQAYNYSFVPNAPTGFPQPIPPFGSSSSTFNTYNSPLNAANTIPIPQSILPNPNSNTDYYGNPNELNSNASPQIPQSQSEQQRQQLVQLQQQQQLIPLQQQQLAHQQQQQHLIHQQQQLAKQQQQQYYEENPEQLQQLPSQQQQPQQDFAPNPQNSGPRKRRPKTARPRNAPPFPNQLPTETGVSNFNDDHFPRVTPIQGPIFAKDGFVPVVPLYSYPATNNGTFYQIPILWTALSYALGLEIRGEILRGLPCIKRLNQLFCPTAGNTYPLDHIERFIDENKALIKRMYGEFIMNPESYVGPVGGNNLRRSAREIYEDDIPNFFGRSNTKRHTEGHNGNGTSSAHIRTARQTVNPRNGGPTQQPKSNRIDSCESTVEIVTPYWAANSSGKVRAIVNTQHFEQAIHQEVCAKGHTKRCTGDCACEQKYKWHRLLAYDPDNDCRGIFMDWFLFPSCCVCRCNP